MACKALLMTCLLLAALLAVYAEPGGTIVRYRHHYVAPVARYVLGHYHDHHDHHHDHLDYHDHHDHHDHHSGHLHYHPEHYHLDHYHLHHL